jgi:hypothetical protein
MEKKKNEQTKLTVISDEEMKKREKVLRSAARGLKKVYKLRLDEFDLLTKQSKKLNKKEEKDLEPLVNPGIPEKILSKIREAKKNAKGLSLELYEDIEKYIIKRINEKSKAKK